MSGRILSDWRAAVRGPSSACATIGISLIVCAFVCMNTGAADAATRTWNGPDGGAWSNGAHWSPSGPIDPGDDLLFTGDAGVSSVNDLTALFALGRLTFEATHFISGNSLTLSTGIVASAGTPDVNLTIVLASDQTWTTDGAEVDVSWVNLNGHTWTLAGSGVHFRPGFISGGGAIDVAMGPSGAMLLPNGSNFTGQLSIVSGRVEAGTALALGTGDGTPENGTIIGAGATLRFTNVASIAGEWITVSGDGVAPGMAALDIVNDGGPVTITAPVTLSGASRVSVTTTVGAAQTATFQQALAGLGTLVVDKAGTIVLGASSNAIAGIAFTPTSTGTVRIGAPNALPATVAVSLSAAATFDLNSLPTTVGSLTGDGTVMLTTSGLGGTLTVDNVADTVFNGAISGMGMVTAALVKRGAGELALTNASTYIGITIVEGGTLRVAHPSALGSAINGWIDTTHVKTGARLMLDGVAIGSEPLDIGGVIGTPARLQVTGGTPSSWAGPVTIVGSTVITGTGGANLTLSGGVFGTEALAVQAPMTLHLTSTNLGFDGDLLVTGATVDAAPGAFSARTLTIAGGTLALNGGMASLTALSGSGTVALGVNGSLNLNHTTPVSFGGSITGQGIVTKTGSGDLTLTGANPFGGLLRITQGRLIVAHAQAHSAAELVVDDGAGAEYQTAASTTASATLAGTGPGNAGTLQVLGGDVTFGGLVRLVGQTLLEVAPARTLTMTAITSLSALRFGGGGTVVVGSSGTDLISVVFGADGLAPGTLRMGGPGALNPQAIHVPAGGTLDLGGFGLQLTGISGPGHIAIGTGRLMLHEATADVAFGGTLSGTGTGHFVVDIGPHAFRLSGTHTFSGLFQTEGGPLFLSGVLPAAIMTDETAITFEGDSVVGDLLLQGGTVVVGDGVTPATVRATALSLVYSPLKLWIHMPAQGAAAAPFTVAGGVNVQGTTLELAFTGIAPTESSPLTLIDNTGSALVVGEFSDLPDRALVDVGNGVRLLIRYAGGNGNDVTLGAPVSTSYLAEGATGTFFDTDLLIANPHAVAVTATITFLPQDAPPQTITRAIEPMSRVTIAVDEIPGLESVALSTIVASHAATPLVVERTMTWDASAYGAHTEKATAGDARTWIFAEGSEGGAGGFFRTFLLLANPDTAPNVATVEYLREGESPLVRTYDLPPLSRVTVAAAEDPELVGRSFGTSVSFDRPGVAERAMYFGANPIWTGGHESAGVTTPSYAWFLAEGATGDGFDTFILVANPQDDPADVELRFLTETGEPATLTKTLPAKSRLTVNIETDMPGLPPGPVATLVWSSQPVVAERAQYWPLTPDRWLEAHNSFGVTNPAMKWGLAEGRTGGAEQYQTFILLANPGIEPATVTLAFLGDGASPAPANRTIVVPGQRRVTVPAEAPEPSSTVTTFGTLLTADQPIVVERAMYWNAGGQVWAAGTNATATRLP